jgi:phosphoglycolate phosphatase-like HAD superfamily hydrolase
MREEFFVNYERRMTERTYAFEGVPTLLAGPGGRQLPWGVVTNKSMRFTDAIDPNHAAVCQVRRTVVAATPRPMPNRIRRRCWRPPALGVSPPAACLYVGDDERDIVAGWQQAWARWPPPMATWAATGDTLGNGAPMRLFHRRAHAALEIAELRLK